MEIRIYDLKNKNEEFKDLNYDQLMAIAELCMKYYESGQDNATNDALEDKNSEIEDLENQLEDSDYEFNRLQDKYDNLKEQYDELLKKKENLQKVVDDTVFKRVKKELDDLL